MRRIIYAVVSALLVLGNPAHAQDKQDKSKQPAAAAQPAGSVAAAKSPPAPAAKKIPDDYKLNILIRSTIIAVNQANKTSNYTVLRDLSAPGFKQANSTEKLAEIFAGLRTTKFDLSPILFYSPKLLKRPGLMENGMLRLTGFFDTRPQRVNFDLAFEENGGEWLLYGVSLGTKLAPPASAQAAPQPPAAGGTAAAPAAQAAPPADTKEKKK